jgi:hypothetical protein
MSSTDCFVYNTEEIVPYSISAFKQGAKRWNDKNNKTRENVIGSIINNVVPEEFYLSTAWVRLKRIIHSYLITLGKEKRPDVYTRATCVHKAGRRNNYDFSIELEYENGKEIYDVELKFNASSINKTPQFVSPMKPSQYLSASYEEYYFTNYLPILFEKISLPLPSWEEYIKQIHSTEPPCMKKIQEVYYNGCKKSSKYTGNSDDISFYTLSNDLSRKSISSFISQATLNIPKMNEYLQKTQENKIYMLFWNKTFVLEKPEEYKIVECIKNPTKYRYDCKMESGKEIKILMRWKNGNGVAFPSFQIS